MLTRPLWLLALVCLFALSGACAPIHYGEQELTLRHDAKAGTLDLLIVYDSIQAEPQEDKDGLDVGLRFAANVSSGKREFLIYDWPLHIDVDKAVQQPDESGDSDRNPWKEWEHDFRSVVVGLKVVSSGYCRDPLDRISMYQQLRFANASRLVAWLQRGLWLWIEDTASENRLEKDAPWLDGRSCELWLAMAREKQSWLYLKDGALTLDLPATSASAARMLTELTRAFADESDGSGFVAGLCSHLSELKIADDHVVMRWKLDGPTWTFAPPKPQDYDASLAKSVRASNDLPETLPTRDELYKKLRQH